MGSALRPGLSDGRARCTLSSALFQTHQRHEEKWLCWETINEAAADWREQRPRAQIRKQPNEEESLGAADGSGKRLPSETTRRAAKTTVQSFCHEKVGEKHSLSVSAEDEGKPPDTFHVSVQHNNHSSAQICGSFQTFCCSKTKRTSMGGRKHWITATHDKRSHFMPNIDDSLPDRSGYLVVPHADVGPDVVIDDRLLLTFRLQTHKTGFLLRWWGGGMKRAACVTGWTHTGRSAGSSPACVLSHTCVRARPSVNIIRGVVQLTVESAVGFF